VQREAGPRNCPPPGLLYRAAGPTDEGWYVIEVRDAQEALDRFFQERRCHPVLMWL
jgi:hypothetical protein